MIEFHEDVQIKNRPKSMLTNDSVLTLKDIDQTFVEITTSNMGWLLQNTSNTVKVFKADVSGTASLTTTNRPQNSYLRLDIDGLITWTAIRYSTTGYRLFINPIGSNPDSMIIRTQRFRDTSITYTAGREPNCPPINFANNFNGGASGNGNAYVDFTLSAAQANAAELVICDCTRNYLGNGGIAPSRYEVYMQFMANNTQEFCVSVRKVA